MIYRFAPNRSAASVAAIEACKVLRVAHHARAEDGEVDCLGLMLAAHARGGVEYDRRPFDIPYALDWFRINPSRLVDGLIKLGWTRVRRRVEEMDILIAATLSHIGDHPLVYVGGGQLMHAWSMKVGLVDVESSEGRAWLRRVTIALRPAVVRGGTPCRQLQSQ